MLRISQDTMMRHSSSARLCPSCFMFTSGVAFPAKRNHRSDIVSAEVLGIVETMLPLEVDGVEDSWHVCRHPMALVSLKIAIGHRSRGCSWASLPTSENLEIAGLTTRSQIRLPTLIHGFYGWWRRQCC